MDIAAAFPELVPLARQTARLHPRLGEPTVHDSSVGGPLLWPVSEPWPVCEGPHPEEDEGDLPVSLADIRRRRELYETHPDDREEAALDATSAGHPWSRKPNALLPVAQLYARDIPSLPCPEGADMLQVLWCPLNHDPSWMPTARVVWGSSTQVDVLLTDPPLPADVENYGNYVPEPCVLHPEVVTEYPALLELEADLADRIEDWCEREFTGTDPRYRYAEEFRAYYQYELSVALAGRSAVGGRGASAIRR
ncbi:hypothetical protein ACFV84_16835 [Kitasatospora sp. NPDC059811]|uniref:hypothetical protein n=1 Tax=Streptomycetaceae TaxID=2062 RepID=UPI00099FE0AB|nr:hypothetical protein [Streptomyces sp. MJM8645]